VLDLLTDSMPWSGRNGHNWAVGFLVDFMVHLKNLIGYRRMCGDWLKGFALGMLSAAPA